MDLLEYQGKQLFARHGVPVPSGSPATTVEEAVAAADEIGYPCVVKAQVQIGGRGKAGGIKVAKNRTEAEAHAEGEFQASQRLRDAADVISGNPASLQLRYLQTLTEIGATQNTTVVFPLPMDMVKPFVDAVADTQKALGNGVPTG